MKARLFFFLSVFLIGTNFIFNIEGTTSQIPQGTDTYLGNGYPLSNGDPDQVNVVFFEVPDTVSSTLYFSVYDPGVAPGVSSDGDQVTTPGNQDFYLIGGTGALTSPTSNQLTYSTQTDALAGTTLSQISILAANVNQAGYNDLWYYFPQGVSPSQGEHVGNKYYFKLVFIGERTGAYKNLFKYDISYSTSGDPSGVSGVRSFAYKWAIGPWDTNGRQYNIYPFVPETALSTDYVVMQSFDLDDHEDLGGFAYNGDVDFDGIPDDVDDYTYNLETLNTMTSSPDSTVTSEEYLISTVETNTGQVQRNRTWRYVLNETSIPADSNRANLAYLYATLDDDIVGSMTDGTVLRSYSYPISDPPVADHVTITPQDGSGIANNSDTEQITLQVVDSSGNPVNYLRNIYVSLNDPGTNPALIYEVNGVVTNSSTALITTDNFGLGTITLIRDNDGVSDGSVFNVVLNVYWDETGGSDGATGGLFASPGNDSSNTIVFYEDPDPTLSSATNQNFEVGDPSTAIPALTVDHLSTAKITAANDLRIQIPAALDAHFDTSITDLSGNIVVTGTGTISTTVSYPDSKTLLIDVTGNFAQNDLLYINALQLMTFGSLSSGSLVLSYDGGTTYNVFDDKVYQIDDPNIDVTWTGGVSTDWNTAGNWSPSGVPGATDQVFIPSGANQPVMNSTVSIAKLTLAGSTTLSTGGNDLFIAGDLDSSGTINAGGGGTIAVSGNSVTLGAFTGAAGNTLVLNYPGAVTFDSNSQPLGNFTIDTGVGGTLTLEAPLDVNEDLTISSGTLDVSASDYQINVAGNWDGSGGSFTPQNGTVVFDGTGNIGSEDFYNLTVNTTGTHTAVGGIVVTGDFAVTGGTFAGGSASLQVTGNWDVSAGSFTSSTSTVTFTGAGDTDGTSFYNMVLNSAGFTRTLSDNISATGSVTLTAGTIDPQGNNITTAGDWDDSGVTFTPSGGTVTLNDPDPAITQGGTNNFFNLTLNCSGTASAGSTLNIDGALTISGGTFDGNGQVIYVTGDFTNNGTFTANLSNIIFTGAGNIPVETFYGLTINCSGYTRTMDGNIVVGYSLGLSGGTLDTGGYNIQTAGNWDDSAASFTFAPTGGTVTLTAANASITQKAGNSFFNLTVNNNALLTSGIDVNGNLSVTGDLNASSQTIDVAGNWSVGGTFTPGTGTVVFDGTGTTSSETFNNLTIDAGAAETRTFSGNVTVTGISTFTAGILDPGTTTFTTAGNWNDSAADFTFTPAGGTVVLTSTGPAITSKAGNNFYNLTLNDGGSLSSDVNVDGNFTISGGAFSGSTFTMSIAGDWNNSGTFTINSSTVIFTGAGSVNDGEIFYNLEINSPADTRTLNNSITVANNITITAGILDATDDTIFMTGEGDGIATWQNDVGFGGFIYNGSNLELQASSEIYVRGSTEFNDFTCVNTGSDGARTIYFQEQKEQVFHGEFKINGRISGTRIFLKTSYAGADPTGNAGHPTYTDLQNAQWIITIAAGGSALVDYADVSASYATEIITATTNTISSSVPTGNNANWLFVISIVSYQTQDKDHNGKIDTILVRTSADLNDVFTNFTVRVIGYEVIFPCNTGSTALDPYFEIPLVEGDYLDTDARPWWYIWENDLADPLAANVGGSVIVPTGDQYQSSDDADPIIGYTLAAAEKNQIFVHFSEPVERSGGGQIGAMDFSYSGGTINNATVITGSGGMTREILLTLDAPLTPGDLLTPETITVASLQDQENSFDLSYRDLVNPVHRVSDIGLGLKGRGLVEPVVAFDTTARDDVTQGIGKIEKVNYGDFDGTGWLRDTDIILQAGIHSDIAGGGLVIPLYYDTATPGTLVNGQGLWLPSYSDTSFNGLVPFPNEPVYGGGNSINGESVISPQVREYFFSSADGAVDAGNTLTFLFEIPTVSPDPLYCARLASPTAADWYRSVKPWSFEIHDVVDQGSHVTIMHNVIDPTKNERTDLFYVLDQQGRVSITVYTLAGDIVTHLLRDTQSEGKYTVSWDGKNRRGRVVARGLYFIKITAPGIEEIRKVMVVKD